MNGTVVALPGFLGRGSDWEEVRAASQAGLRWICLDLFAPGAEPVRPPSVEGPCWLAGYSFGARLALRWLQDAPEKWQGALLLSVNPGNFQSEEERVARRKSDADWSAAFRAERWAVVTDRWNAQAVFQDGDAPPREERDFDREKLAAAFRDYSVADQFTDILRLPVPLVWMAGARDGKFVRLQNLMRNAGFPGTFPVVGEAGHRLLHEAPDAVAGALDDLVA
jgi:2-succinyl-6-hydroxy-2,4-cyclohexadiene-1-carboxylate synthase